MSRPSTTMVKTLRLVGKLSLFNYLEIDANGVEIDTNMLVVVLIDANYACCKLYLLCKYLLLC
jgi:hypothetical protein